MTFAYERQSYQSQPASRYVTETAAADYLGISPRRRDYRAAGRASRRHGGQEAGQ